MCICESTQLINYLCPFYASFELGPYQTDGIYLTTFEHQTIVLILLDPVYRFDLVLGEPVDPECVWKQVIWSDSKDRR